MPPVNRSRTVVWRPLIVCPQPDVYRRLHAVLTELAVEQPCTLTEYPRSGAIAAMAERNACNVCFLDAATDCEHAQMLISELAPSVPVVALHPRNDADLILRCLRRGASEFVADPTMDAVDGVFERLGADALRCRLPRAGLIVLCDPRQARLRRQHPGRQPGDPITSRWRESGPAGGRRPAYRQYRVHAQTEARVSPGRCAARLGAHG